MSPAMKDDLREQVARAIDFAGPSLAPGWLYPMANAALAVMQSHYDARVRELEAINYKTFTDGMEAAAEICGSLAETTYDDADGFEAATGCEATIMRVVKEQRREQALGATHD